MFEIIKPGTKIDFVGKRQLWVGLSVVMVVLTFVLFLTRGLNYGIDFTGGAEVEIQVPKDWDISRVRDTLESGAIKGLKVQQIGEAGAGQYLVKAQGDEQSLNQVAQQVESTLAKTLKKGTDYSVERVSVVGPAAGSSLRTSGFLAMFYALLSILVYVGIRFDYRYAPGAVVALFHDSVITLGVFVILQKQFDLQILAAILALIGYSNNDTIIVFDRVRETVHLHPGMSIEEAVNKSINETLGRTFLTSFSTFLTVFALWAFGGSVIQDFAFTLMIGIVVGTYSSIFIASSLVIYMTHYQEKREARAKAGGGPAKKRITVRPEPKFQA